MEDSVPLGSLLGRGEPAEEVWVLPEPSGAVFLAGRFASSTQEVLNSSSRGGGCKADKDVEAIL